MEAALEWRETTPLVHAGLVERPAALPSVLGGLRCCASVVALVRVPSCCSVLSHSRAAAVAAVAVYRIGRWLEAFWISCCHGCSLVLVVCQSQSPRHCLHGVGRCHPIQVSLSCKGTCAGTDAPCDGCIGAQQLARIGRHSTGLCRRALAFSWLPLCVVCVSVV